MGILPVTISLVFRTNRYKSSVQSEKLMRGSDIMNIEKFLSVNKEDIVFGIVGSSVSVLLLYIISSI